MDVREAPFALELPEIEDGVFFARAEHAWRILNSPPPFNHDLPAVDVKTTRMMLGLGFAAVASGSKGSNKWEGKRATRSSSGTDQIHGS